MREKRILVLSAMMAGAVCLLPVVGFVLYSLWSQRVLVSWLMLGLVGLVVVAHLVLWVIKVATRAKVDLAEEALRPGRLHAHERLVAQEKRYDAGWMTQQQQPMVQKPYVQQTLVQGPYQQAPYTRFPSSYNGLEPLSVQDRDGEWGW